MCLVSCQTEQLDDADLADLKRAVATLLRASPHEPRV
jgi:hypothetical protein